MATGIGRSAAAETRRRALRAGQRAELLAMLYLRLKGYRILARHYCIRGGEIDLIAQKASTVAFVEVKYRPTLAEAMIAIDPWKCRRISRAAAHWLASNPWAASLTLRGDAVYLAPRKWPRHMIAGVPLDFH